MAGLQAKLQGIEERHALEVDTVKKERDELQQEIQDMHEKHEKSKKKLQAEVNQLKEQVRHPPPPTESTN